MGKISFVHLSDLHYGKAWEADVRTVIDALIADLAKLETEEHIQPSFVVFSGDLVQAGNVADDFEAAYDILVHPVVNVLGLEPGLFFFAPGNHDIDTDLVDENLDAGVREGCKSSHGINRIIDSFPTKPYYLHRLDQFNRFIDSHPSTGLSANTPLYRSYAFDVDRAAVGLCTLNSCWRATGRPGIADYGNLSIGERQIDSALQAVKDCDLRIGAMHHSFPWLSPMEQGSTKRRAFSEFDVLLFGHNHDPDSERVEHMAASAVMSHCGCLYQSRDYINGYTIISCDIASDEVTLQLRSYFDQRREFGKAENVISDGKKTLSLRTRKRRMCKSPENTDSGKGESLSVPSLGDFKAKLNADGRLEVFARDEAGALWHIWQDPNCPGGWSNWAPLDGSIETFVVVLNRDGLLEVFGRARDKAVCHIWQDSRTYSSWSDWHTLGGSVDVFRVAQNLDGRLEIFAKWEDGTLRHIWHIPNGWSSWENLEGQIDTFEVSRNADGRLEVFSQWRDGLRRHTWQVTGVGWSGWHPLG